MLKSTTVSGRMIDLRSDHLIAVVEYALEQALTSEIEVLNFGDNENYLQGSEQIDYIKEMLNSLEKLTAKGNQDLLIVAPSEEQLTRYHKI